MKLAIDMASILKTCLAVGKDVEGQEVEFEGKRHYINSAAYGYENTINSIKAAMDEFSLAPIDLILVQEGMHSKSRRCMIDAGYKSKRTSSPPQYYEQYNALKQQVEDTLVSLGAIALCQDFVEGDDVLGHLAYNTEEDMVIMSNDGDMTVLNMACNSYGAEVKVRINGETGHNKYGPFDYSLVTGYKALVGDSSDSIKGCPGFGPKAFDAFFALYGEDGLREIQGMMEAMDFRQLEQLAADNKCKLLQKIFDERDTVLRSYQLAKLHPEWVDTMKHKLKWRFGMVQRVTDERLRHWNQATRLIDAINFDKALAYLQTKLAESPEVAFDIETSGPQVSLDWLEDSGAPDGVDQFGAELTGFSITFGRNNNTTYYVSVDHAQTANVPMSKAREMIEACFGKPIVIQNTAFELAVLGEAKDEDGSKWTDHWEKYGCNGYIPNVLDTKLEASYFDENSKLGLKERSKNLLNYEQQSYDQTTLLDGKPFEGGSERGDKTRYRMKELPASHVLGYGCDDTICTAALHNGYKLFMQLEHTYDVYRTVELDAAYLHAHSFRTGVPFSVEKNNELSLHDTKVGNDAWDVLSKYLIEKGWEGTVPPTYTESITAKEIKQAYAIVKGIEASDDDEEPEEGDEPVEVVVDPILKTRVRTPSKVLALIEAEGHTVFAAKLSQCLDGDGEGFTTYVRSFFTGKPVFKFSNRQMQRLLYEVMGLPVRVTNKPTEKMKAAGKKEGAPKGDALAIAYAKRDATPEQIAVLDAVQLVQMVRKRFSDFYSKYPRLMHWKDGKIHSSHNQCATNTRRASSSNPNFQQLPKHQKLEGQAARFRETLVPHKKNAVVVSMDFEAQELRVIADYSQDENMLKCFVGEVPLDMHVLTALGILSRKEKGWSYDTYMEALGDTSNPHYKKCKEFRALGKKTNFTTEYGAAAPKLAQTLLISEEEAQIYIDAKEAAFPRASAWKQEVVAEAKRHGFVRTKMGAKRHLRELFASPDKFTASKAERQAVNFKIQSSSAEMTKLAEGRMWKAGIFQKFDAHYYGPVHDECVASVAIEDLFDFIPAMHKCMVAPYADMTVPIGSSISFGPSFGVQIEIGNAPTKAAIEAGLKELCSA